MDWWKDSIANLKQHWCPLQQHLVTWPSTRAARHSVIPESRSEVLHSRTGLWHHTCLPGDFFLSSPAVANTVPDPLSYVERLRSTMSYLTATLPRHPSKSLSQVLANLSSCTHAFTRQDAVRRCLQQPYNGPFPIIHRQSKYFIIQENRKLNPSALTVSNPPSY